MISDVRIFNGPAPLAGRVPDRVVPMSSIDCTTADPVSIQKAHKKRGGCWTSKTCPICDLRRAVPRGAPAICQACEIK